jgi:multiple sugar transport system permease protein
MIDHLMAPSQIRERARSRVFPIVSRVLFYGLLIASALFMIAPFIWMVSTSLNSDQDILAFPPRFFAPPLTLKSYFQLFELFPMGRMFLNSLTVAVITTLFQLITSAMAAYAFARMKFKGSNALFLVYLAVLMVPYQVTITPLFVMISKVGWVNSYQGLILPGIFSAFGTFMLRQFFLSLPRELEEAAFMDGASHLTVFVQIILPLAKSALATLTVFAFMASWNAFLWPLFVVRDTELMTLPVGLAALHGRWSTQWNLVMAGSVITVIPMLVMYLFAQRFVVQGFVMSGLKG